MRLDFRNNQTACLGFGAASICICTCGKGLVLQRRFYFVTLQTPKVLQVLKEYQVTACFFCIGHKVKGNEAILQKMVAEGHLIGNHSHTHSGLFPLYGLSKMKKDLQTCQCELERVTSQPVSLFRPPFGVTNPTIAKAVRQLGYTSIGWSIRTQIGRAHV